MATVRTPSSWAVRNTRMAISLRLAASSLPRGREGGSSGMKNILQSPSLSKSRSAGEGRNADRLKTWRRRSPIHAFLRIIGRNHFACSQRAQREFQDIVGVGVGADGRGDRPVVFLAL